MKNILLFILFTVFLVPYSAVSQTTVRGTIIDLAGNAQPNIARVAGKPNIAINNALFGNINITISINDLGASNPTEAQITKSISIPSLELFPPTGNPYVFGGRAYYSYVLTASANPTTTSWSTNFNNPIMELGFPSPVAALDMRLNDVSPTGGPNFQMFWYVQITGPGDITNYAQMFYGTGAVNNGGSSPSNVPLQPFAAPLPVTITSVTARQQADDIVVEWQVTNQLNIAKYEVEKSTDGLIFVRVNTQNALITNTGNAVYNWLDVQAVEGDNFYRIRSIGNNGDVKISQIVKITMGKGKQSITVYPNPVLNKMIFVKFTNLDKGTYQLRLINALGQVIGNHQVIHTGGSGHYTFNLNDKIAAGAYQLEIISPNENKTTNAVIIGN